MHMHYAQRILIVSLYFCLFSTIRKSNLELYALMCVLMLCMDSGQLTITCECTGFKCLSVVLGALGVHPRAIRVWGEPLVGWSITMLWRRPSHSPLASGDPGPESGVLVREWDPEINITAIIVQVDWITQGDILVQHRVLVKSFFQMLTAWYDWCGTLERM